MFAKCMKSLLNKACIPSLTHEILGDKPFKTRLSDTLKPQSLPDGVSLFQGLFLLRDYSGQMWWLQPHAGVQKPVTLTPSGVRTFRSSS